MENLDYLLKRYAELTDELKEYEKLVDEREDVLNQIKEIGAEILDGSPFSTARFGRENLLVKVQNQTKLELVDTSIFDKYPNWGLLFYEEARVKYKIDDPDFKTAVIALLTGSYDIAKEEVKLLKDKFDQRTLGVLVQSAKSISRLTTKLSKLVDESEVLFYCELIQKKRSSELVAKFFGSDPIGYRTNLEKYFTLNISPRCEVEFF